ncbi:MAG TPA: asparagine synthase-related protein [Vicinamibacterales bacterium]|nr:asparagine synthase-related protein [Vicinamibacterales bacterium]
MACVAAIFNTDGAPVDRTALGSLMDVEPYRRPGGQHLTIDGCVGLGCAPLAAESIGDQARQPRGLENRLWAVLDGRLDDRGSLIAALQPSSARSRVEPRSDVDMILSAYDCWGVECVSHLTGDFAFCLWDAQRRRLFCARDRFGVKPFYYAHVGRTLLVCSTLRTLRRHPLVSDRLRDEAIGDFLLFGLCVEPSQTSFADLQRLPPAHRLTCSPEGPPRVDRYWRLEPADLDRESDPRHRVERFSRLMREAVADRIRSDRTAVLMSGGLDSSSVASVAAEIARPKTDRLHAYTLVYDAQARDEERRYSSIVARSLGIGITHLPVDDYEPFARWDRDALPPEPSLEGLSAVMSDVLDLASAHGHVVLTGEGGDPLLLPSTIIEQVGWVPFSSLAGDVWRACRAGSLPPVGLRSTLRGWFRRSRGVPTWLADGLLRAFDPHERWREVGAARTAARGARSRALNDLVDPWWPSTFESLDPGATGRPVQVRYPFFDVRLVTYALTLPTPWCVNKRILRASMRDRLPGAVLARPKTPLQADPVGPRGRWSLERATRLLASTPDITRYVNVDRFRSTVRHDSLLTDRSPGTWAAISLANWIRCSAGGPAPTELN